MSKMTLEQKRSQAAWAMAKDGLALAAGEYTNLAKAAPALIMNNGLMQTLAKLCVRASSQSLRICTRVASGLRRV